MANSTQSPTPAKSPLEETLDKIKKPEQDKVSKVGWFSDWTESFKDIEQQADEFFRKQIQDVPEANLKDLIELVKNRRERLSLSSGITSQIVGICQQLLAFGAAGLALTIGFIDKIRQFSIPVQKYLALVGIFYFELVLVSLLVLTLYTLQARFRYPSIYFDKIGNAWPFFYYATITPVPRFPLQTSRHRFKASAEYAKDLLKFADDVLKEDPRERLQLELQQYFLLMSYQAYVHQFSLRLARLFMYGFAGALVTAVAMLVGVKVGLL